MREYFRMTFFSGYNENSKFEYFIQVWLRARGQEWRLGARAVARAEIYGSGVGLGFRTGD